MATLAEVIEQWLREKVEGAGAEGVAVGLSGGIDSSVVATLAARAFGPDRVTGVIMPARSQPADVEDARMLASQLGITSLEIDLEIPFSAMLDTLPEGSDLAVANLKPRLRMMTLYHIANTNNLVVAGTGNKTELMVGYFTKYGDGGVDLLPLGALYKHQVRDLARGIGVPQAIIDRPPSAGLWAGQTDEDEMGITYEELDAILEALEQGVDTSRFDVDRVKQVRTMVARTAHKRSMPPIFELSTPLSMLETA
ncbi:MAG: NAD+ synthase [Thermomicrobiaceae bacterium]